MTAGTPATRGATLLSAEHLRVEVLTSEGSRCVVDDVDLYVGERESVGLVGESGSGKSITAYALLRLLDPASARLAAGRVMLGERDLTTLPRRSMERVRGREIAMIFQEPMTSLDPVFRIGDQIAEAVRWHLGMSRTAARARAASLLELVQIPTARRRAYPHELSGGMRQRAMIAMALSCDPKLLIADEPTTALDVTIQAQILDLLRECRDEFDMALLLISHDLGVVADVCDRVMVMYAGQIVEHAATDAMFERPLHPYTASLLDAADPLVRRRAGSVRAVTAAETGAWTSGCRYRPRCPHSVTACEATPIPDVAAGAGSAKCLRAEELDLSRYA